MPESATNAEVFDLALYRALMAATEPFDGVALTVAMRADMDRAILGALRQFIPDATIDDAAAMTSSALGVCTPDDPAPKLPWR